MPVDAYRACSPSETFDRVAPFLGRLGITRLARQTGLDDIGIPVWCAYTPNAKAVVIAQGKGMDDDAAKTSAVMEAIERSVATNPACKRVLTNRAWLEEQGELVFSLDLLLSPHARAVAPSEDIEWMQAEQLLTSHRPWLPFEAIHLDRTLENPRYWRSSDGLASGNTRDEALLHAVLERVERDALTLWQVTPARKRYHSAIDPKTIEYPDIQQALEKIAGAGLEIALFDITTDLAIPCVVALLGPKNRSRGQVRHVDITLGAGASLSALAAASRAITEAVQSRMTFIAGARDDLLPNMFVRKADPSTLLAMEAEACRDFQTLPSLNVTPGTSPLETVLARLGTSGITQLYAVDLAPDWLPAFVVKVIAPQLENPDGDRHRRFGNRALSRAL
ncbi:YcaO-like family protein [Rhizobium sp. Leaf262]|uniref:YcaO-like family protein n=1 Tax=Rhizobium sp. Leaf262 TaxID=1736312 RepID=UPI0007152C57|nr:YcaO-like family protein [Rhizobium sp. Leaf262]KQO83360.1 hypothetical protein ASF29_00510 [Rhizobium sp. Leaf262]